MESVLRTKPNIDEIKKLAKENNLDYRVAENILGHFFLFNKKLAEGPDTRPCRWRYFGVLAMREGFEK